MGKVFVQVLVLMLLSGSVALAQDSYKRSQYFRAITFQHIVTSVVEGDINGDGSPETVVCYREPGDAVNQPGGVMVLSAAGGDFAVAWHAVFENAYPKQVAISGSTLSFDLVQATMHEDKVVKKTMVKGKDFFFRDEDGSPFAGVKISASSTLKKDSIRPGNVFDRDLKTAWAEGADGTGVDESVTIEFKKPVNLGLIGVLHGNYEGRRFWRDNNRVHRAAVTVETSADRFDTASNVDLDTDLGLGLYGDQIELNFSNKPLMCYFKLWKKSVLSLELKITSVLLGEKNDDAYIAEIDFAELITSAEIFGTAKKTTDKAIKAKKAAKEEKAPAGEQVDWTNDDGF
ncbi:MAG TPA: hypothetical protein VM425_12205 [Myxococcota bacterium]|nr:hypothetical protein [Myxococcota bacterium]